MSKHGGYLTPKAIAIRMKAKGLQKLRWYCQMCRKQCRDANGFKCHKTSEGHQRMMRIFRENRSTILDNYSREFEKCFMDLVRRRWRTKRVFANKVYNEYISDRHHIHMNATVWESLASFVRHLGRTKQCEVDQTEKGWYIKYIDKDPDILAQQEAIKKKEKMDMDDDMRNRERIQKMIAALHGNTLTENEEFFLESSCEDDDDESVKKDDMSETEKIQFNLLTPISVASTPALPKKITFLDDSEVSSTTVPDPTNDKDTKSEDPVNDTQVSELKRRLSEPNINETSQNPKKIRKLESKPSQLSALEELTSAFQKKQTIREIENNKKKQAQLEKEKKKELEQQALEESIAEVTDNWLIPGLIVKVQNNKIGNGIYYGKKGKVIDVVDIYVGIIQMLDTNHKLKIDQAQLETVIPAIGSDIAIVNGEYKGKVGILEEVEVDNYKAVVRVDDITIKKDYEDVCKISEI